MSRFGFDRDVGVASLPSSRMGPSSRSTSSHHSPVTLSSHPSLNICLAICPCPLPGPHGSPPALPQLTLAPTNGATNLPTSAQPQPWNAVRFQEVLKPLHWKFFEDPALFFFQEKRGIFVRKHHHSIQGNNTPGIGGFHGQGSAGHVPQSPDLLRGCLEAAKPPMPRHREATSGSGQIKLASHVPWGHGKEENTFLQSHSWARAGRNYNRASAVLV